MNCILQQEQQGFFPSVSVIKCESNKSSRAELSKPLDYQPRVLVNTKIQKLPAQMIQAIDEIPTIEGCCPILDQAQKQKTISQSAYEKYISRSQYKLVYNKYDENKFEKGGQYLGKRTINLSPYLQFDPQNYKILKQSKLQISKNIGKQGLIFDSHFQCANLLYVYKSLKEMNTYDCFIENDTNTSGYNQWFYFSIQNMRKDTLYHFNIVNFTKKFSFLKMGMKPTFFSTERYKSQGNGWYRKGYNIRYRVSDIYDVKEGIKQRLYSASFSIDFDYAPDFVTISLALPYSYSRLVKSLKLFRNNAQQQGILWKEKTICHTISCNQVPYLSITKNNIKNLQESEVKQKKVIILLARQHPGQINSSFMMQKILEGLSKCKNNKIDWLLNKFEFRIFPMVNVDGVIYGNFRCDLVGFDLNRCWKNPIIQLHPQIAAIKKQILKIKKYYQIVCCIDIHSHSNQLNVFAYCNKQDEVQSRLFSLIMSKNCPFFYFPFCTFGISKEKQSTARAVLGEVTTNQNCLTIQFSSFGFKTQNGSKGFTLSSFQQAAIALFTSLKNYLCNSKQRRICLNEIQDNIFKYRSYCKKGCQYSGSQSDDVVQQFNQLQAKLKTILPLELISVIKKRLKQPLPIKNEIKKQEIQQIQNSLIQMPIKKSPPKIIQKRIPVVYQKPIIKRQPEILTKKNIDQQVNIQYIAHRAWKIKSQHSRVKTEPRNSQNISKSQRSQKCVRYSTPNKIIIGHKNQFKNSMKILYGELLTAKKIEQNAINELKDTNNLEKQQEQRSNRLQKIMKVRRRPNQLKQLLNRWQNGQDATLLRIRSSYTTQAIDVTTHSVSPPSRNSKLQELLISKEANPKDNYVSHMSFLNRFLKKNIKQVFEQK